MLINYYFTNFTKINNSMRFYKYIFILGLLVSFSSCRKDFSTVASTGNLEFSKTKVYLDTVFSNIGSSTYSLKVYNRSNNDIKIPTVQLAKGLNSKYRIMVDGITGNNKIFNNIELLAKDSLYIFIETTANIADANTTDFTYNDEILFDTGNNQQKVDLITLIRDCHFIKPNRSLNPTLYEVINVNGFVNNDNSLQTGHTLTSTELNWTAAKPYVVYGNCVVPNGSTLNIAAGTQVYFHENATLIVDNGATLNIDGAVNTFDIDGKILIRNEVTFEGDRLEPEYEDVPGQWGAIFILSNTNNQIKHLTLKNSVAGLVLQTNSTLTTIPKLLIDNSQIYNSSFYGILARNSDINSENLVINYAGKACLATVLGGTYNFTHCTFNNNWQSTSQVAVLVSDNIKKDETIYLVANLNTTFKNSIIYGNNKVELFLDKKGDNFVTAFDHCLIKFDDSGTALAGNALFNFIRNQENGNIKNQDPKFKNINRNFMNVLNGSSAIDKANFIAGSKDILDNVRTSPSEIGAYEYLP
jgi:hypothetical protein